MLTVFIRCYYTSFLDFYLIHRSSSPYLHGSLLCCPLCSARQIILAGGSVSFPFVADTLNGILPTAPILSTAKHFVKSGLSDVYTRIFFDENPVWLYKYWLLLIRKTFDRFFRLLSIDHSFRSKWMLLRIRVDSRSY